MEKRTQWIYDPTNDQRYILISHRWRKVTGRRDNRYYIYDLEYAKKLGIEPKHPNDCYAGDWALLNDGKHCMQVLDRRKAKYYEYLVLGTRYFPLSKYHENTLDDTVFYYRSKFYGKYKIPQGKALSTKQRLFAHICAINFLNTGRMNYFDAARKVYGKYIRPLTVKRLIDAPKIQKEIFMTLRDLLNKTGTTPEYSLEKLKEFLESEEFPAELKVDLLKTLMYVQGLPLKEHAEHHQRNSKQKYIEGFLAQLEEGDKEEKKALPEEIVKDLDDEQD